MAGRLIRVSLVLCLAFSLIPWIPLTAAATPPPGAELTISQVYGGGGNAGATYRNDFVEIHNPTNHPVSVDGWCVQYASAAGDWTLFPMITPLSGTVPAGGYYLVRQAAGAGGTADLPTPDAVGTTNMAASNGKVALVSNTTAITDKTDPDIVDLVGYGATANEYEGSGPTPTLANTTAAFRLDNGRQDTDVNSADFVVAAPAPRNSASAIYLPPNTAVADSYSVNEDEMLLQFAPGVLGNDVGVTTATLQADLTAHGWLDFYEDGSFMYFPDSNWSGTEYFTYQASNGATLSAPATVTITVNSVNDLPTSSNDPFPASGAVSTKLSDGGVLNSERFGLTSAISGDTAVFAMPEWSSQTGRVYVYVRSGAAWVQQQILTASDGAAGAWFGQSVDIEGDTIVVGAGGAGGAGAAYVFARSAGVWAQQQRLSAGTAGEAMGTDVDIAGDDIIVGAGSADGGNGAAYVYALSDATWALQQRLTASDAAPGGDRFGDAVAIDGDTALVGAHMHDHGGMGNCGAAYVFRRSGTTWSQERELLSSPYSHHYEFGYSVGLQNGKALVGSYAFDGANPFSGAVFAYTYTDSSWTYRQRFADGGPFNDFAGFSIALDGDLAVVSCHGSDTWASFGGQAYVYRWNGGSWVLASTVRASDPGANKVFSYSVGLSRGTAVFGSPATFTQLGAGYVADIAYTTPKNTPLTIAAPGLLANDSDVEGPLSAVVEALPAHGTVTVAPDGGFLYTPAPGYEGADTFTYRASDGDAQSSPSTVLIAVLPGPNWLPVASGDTGTVAEDTTLTVDAPGLLANDNDPDANPLTAELVAGCTNGTITVNADGSYTYRPDPEFSGVDVATYRVSDGLDWSASADITITVTPVDDPPRAIDDGTMRVWASNHTPNAYFGRDVAISGDTAIIGAMYGDGAVVRSGTAYIYVRQGATWVQQAMLQAPDGAAENQFGITVALDGDTAVVGAPHNSGSAGKVYVFTRSGGTWSQEATLTPAGAAAGDHFGYSVAIVGDTLLASASERTSAAGTAAGAAYVFTRSAGLWSETQRLEASDAAAFDYFGYSATMDADSIIVGAYMHDHGVGNAGSAYVFKDVAGVWTEEGELLASTRLSGDNLGWSVAISGDTALVGVPGRDTVAGVDVGAAYVFTRSAGVWGEQAELSAAGGVARDSFGLGVAVEGDTALVGAPLYSGGYHGPGYACVFSRAGAVWTEERRLSSTNWEIDYFGYAVTLAGDEALVGAIVHQMQADGSAFFITWQNPCVIPEDGSVFVDVPGMLLNDWDIDSVVLTASVTSGPYHGTLLPNADGSFEYTPDPDWFGIDTFEYRASDGTSLSDTATVTIGVLSVNDTPTVSNMATSTPEDVPLLVGAADGLLSTVVDPDNVYWEAYLAAAPGHGTVDVQPDGSYTYTPSAEYSGTDEFGYVVMDGIGSYSDVATVTITITPVNDAPVPMAQTASVSEDETLTVPAVLGVLFGATDVDSLVLTATVDTPPAHGAVWLAEDGSYVYRPAPDFFGTDEFGFRVSDGDAMSLPATVTVTVLGVNDLPTVSGDTTSTPEDTPLVVPAPGLLALADDVDGDTLTPSVVTSPTHGVLALLPADGSWTYTPDADFDGTDEFSFRVWDGTGYSNTATITIDVTPVNDAPWAAGESFTFDEDSGMHTFPAPGLFSNDGDVDGPYLRFVLEAFSINGVCDIDTDTGAWHYQPDADYNGVDWVRYHVTDGQLDSESVTLTINVTSVPDTVYSSFVANGVTQTVSPTAWFRVPVDVDIVPNRPGLLSACWDSVTGYGASTTVTAEGTSTLYYQTRDGWGIDSEPIQTMQVRVDMTPPLTTTTLTPPYRGTAPISLVASDAVSGVQATVYAIDGGAQQTGSLVNVSGVGTHTVEFWSIDWAGNEEESRSVTVYVGPQYEPAQLSGGDRYAVAAQAALLQFPNWKGTNHVVVACGSDQAIADPLAAAGLAGVYNAPVLLVQTDRREVVPGATMAALAAMKAANGPLNIHIVGGPASVTSGQQRVLARYGRIDRIGGADRYAVAANIATRMRTVLGPSYPRTALIVNGNLPVYFSHALAAGPVAARGHYPILLVKNGSVPLATAAQLGRYSSRIVIGGFGAVGPWAYAVSRATERVTPFDDRSTLAVAVADRFTSGPAPVLTWGSVVISNRMPDSLTGGTAAGLTGGPLLYTDATVLPTATGDALESHRTVISNCTILGGPASISPAVRTQINAKLGI